MFDYLLTMHALLDSSYRYCCVYIYICMYIQVASMCKHVSVDIYNIFSIHRIVDVMSRPAVLCIVSTIVGRIKQLENA